MNSWIARGIFGKKNSHKVEEGQHFFGFCIRE